MIDFLFECMDSIFYNKVRKTKSMRMLDKYIIEISRFIGGDIDKVINSDPVKNYAERLDLLWYLNYLKKHPTEVFRDE